MTPIILKAHGYEAWIDAEHGGSLIRLYRADLKAESLRTPPLDTEPENVFLYGTPPLVPPNRISDARFTFNGKEQVLPVNEPATGCHLHGQLHRMPVKVVEKTDDSVEVLFEAESGEYLNLTYAFAVRFRYTLTETGVLQEAWIENRGEEPMPAGIGWHTTFQVPFVEGSEPKDVRLKVSVGREYLRNMAVFLPTWEYVDDSEFRQQLEAGEITPCDVFFSRHFRQTEPHRMELTDVRAGVKIVYSAPEYDFWMLYNGGSPDFVCVEPQNWLINAPNAPFPVEETGLYPLNPGCMVKYTATISIEKI